MKKRAFASVAKMLQIKNFAFPTCSSLKLLKTTTKERHNSATVVIMRRKFNASIATCYIAHNAMERFTMEKDLLSTTVRNTHNNFVPIGNCFKEPKGRSNGASNTN
jgi:hypothetical protein